LICLFGGTFDPVHVGHVHAARRVCDRLGLDAIRMLLSARPGHRGATGASAARRWDMLKLACAEDGRLVPDDTELRRAERLGRPSYTVETLEELRAGAADAVIAWVVGSDAYREFADWHRWREVFELANLVVLHRPGAELSCSEPLETMTRQRRVARLDARAGQVLVLDTPMLDVSATAVRELLAGTPHGDRRDTTQVADLLPPAVYTYIKEHHLYGVIRDA